MSGRRAAGGGAPARRVPPRFILFDPDGSGWPRVPLPQVAFAGRSNVGKSSLLNALSGRRGLARVSRTPGRTRGIAFFEIDGRYAFADLPGYGFARVSRAERAAWKELVEGYFSSCRLLRKVYVLVDVRRGPEEEEMALSEYLGAAGRPFRWVGTKCDKLSARERASVSAHFSGAPWKDAGGAPILVSAHAHEGLDLLWRDVRAALSGAAAVLFFLLLSGAGGIILSKL